MGIGRAAMPSFLLPPTWVVSSAAAAAMATETGATLECGDFGLLSLAISFEGFAGGSGFFGVGVRDGFFAQSAGPVVVLLVSEDFPFPS